MTHKDNASKPRGTHRPITVIVEQVKPMPTERELPHETQMYINIKGNRLTGEALIAEIQKQLTVADFFAVEISGPS